MIVCFLSHYIWLLVPEINKMHRMTEKCPFFSQKLLWNFTPEENLTAHDVDYLKQLIGYTGPDGTVFKPTTPPSGHRARREYRTLSEAERQRFHATLTRMYQVCSNLEAVLQFINDIF